MRNPYKYGSRGFDYRWDCRDYDPDNYTCGECVDNYCKDYREYRGYGPGPQRRPAPGPRPGHRPEPMPGPGPMPGHHPGPMPGPGPRPGHHPGPGPEHGPGPRFEHWDPYEGPIEKRVCNAPSDSNNREKAHYVGAGIIIGLVLGIIVGYAGSLEE